MLANAHFPTWTVEDALIWICTRDEKVILADARNRETNGWSWIDVVECTSRKPLVTPPDAQSDLAEAIGSGDLNGITCRWRQPVDAVTAFGDEMSLPVTISVRDDVTSDSQEAISFVAISNLAIKTENGRAKLWRWDRNRDMYAPFRFDLLLEPKTVQECFPRPTGMITTSDRVGHAGSLDLHAAQEAVGEAWLFDYLARGKLTATGLTSKLLRKRIPAPYWENASSREDRSGHVVKYIAGEEDGMVAVLAPATEAEPRWRNIRIDRGKLERFLRGASIAVQTKADSEAGCQAWLEQEMRATPEKPMRKPRYAEQAEALFGVVGRGFERVWQQAVSATGSSWSNAGRPRKSRHINRSTEI